MNQLLFLHLEDYWNFGPVSINLSNDFHVSFDSDGLAVEERENFVQDLLGKNITDINVIAGENGVGKTSLLKVIAELTSGSTIYDFPAGYKYALLYKVKNDELLIISNIAKFYYQTKVGKYSIKFIEDGRHDVAHPIIYYSPFLDFNPLDIHTHSQRYPIIDISQSKTVLDDTEEPQDKMEISASLMSHKARNISRQVDFLGDVGNSLSLPFDIPETVYIRFNRLTVKEDDVSDSDNNLFKTLTAHCATWFRGHPRNGLTNIEKAKLMMLRNMLTLYFLSVNNIKTQGILHHIFPANLTEVIEKFEQNRPKDLIDLLITFFDQEDIFKTGIFNELIRLGFEMISNSESELHFNSSNTHLTVEVKTKLEKLRYLLGMINKPLEEGNDKYVIPNLPKFISFDWRNLSSGEKSFLDIFSRLAMSKKELKNSKRNVLILIDEGEMGFHPNWQKKYINYLKLYLNQSYKQFSIQLIVATHSPLVLSDFPKERVHLFKRENGISIQTETFGTFAQNISELLANDFFVESTLIGELAKAYIDMLIKRINQIKVGTSATEIKDIFSAINKIDEPLIAKLLFGELKNKLDAEN